jgi:malate/lactate dehydrogenase
LPRVLKAGGIETTIEPMLSVEEEKALHRSADILRAAAAELAY